MEVRGGQRQTTWQGGWGETVTVPCGERTLETIEIRTRLTS